MEYSKEEKQTIAKMVDNFLLMSNEQRQYVYESSIGKISGIEIAYDAANKLIELKERLDALNVEKN